MQAETRSEIIRCLTLVSEWMAEHFLCLNERKTQILIAAPPEVHNDIVVKGLFFDSIYIRFVERANLPNASLIAARAPPLPPPHIIGP